MKGFYRKHHRKALFSEVKKGCGQCPYIPLNAQCIETAFYMKNEAKSGPINLLSVHAIQA